MSFRWGMRPTKDRSWPSDSEVRGAKWTHLEQTGTSRGSSRYHESQISQSLPKRRSQKALRRAEEMAGLGQAVSCCGLMNPKMQDSDCSQFLVKPRTKARPCGW